MKKKNWIIGYLFFLLSTACTDNHLLDIPTENKGISFQVEDFIFDNRNARTSVEITNEAAKFSWSDNDTIGIFPDTDASQARFSMISGSGTKNAIFDGGGWALKPNSKYASYYPYIADINLNKNKIPVNYSGQLQTKNNLTSHLGAFDFMAAQAVVPENENVQFTFKHLGCLLQLNVNLPKSEIVSSLTLSTDENTFIETGTFNLMKDNIQIEPQTFSNKITLSLNNLSIAKDATLTSYLMVAPVDLSSKEVQVSIQGTDNVYIGSFTAKNLVAGKAYSFTFDLEDNTVTEDDEKDLQTITVKTPGTLSDLLGDKIFQLDSLTLSGTIDSDDVGWLRRMAGGIRDTLDTEFGCLQYLDLTDVVFTMGGSHYLDDGDKYKITSKDKIGNCMFTGCSNLTEIHLPTSIKAIGEASISACTRLKNIVIPENVTSIGNSAFNSCKSLESIVLPSGLVELGRDAFHSCSSLQSIIIPEGVTSIAINTFGHCVSLTDIKFHNKLTSIGNGAFAACDNLTSIEFPSSLKSIGERTFGSCLGLKNVTFTSGNTTLGSYAFENCTALETIVFAEGTTSIPVRVFYGCSNIKEITLPSTLHQIATRAFYAAGAQQPIVVKCHAVTPPELGDDVWKKTGSKLYVPKASLEVYQSSVWKDYFSNITGLD